MRMQYTFYRAEDRTLGVHGLWCLSEEEAKEYLDSKKPFSIGKLTILCNPRIDRTDLIMAINSAIYERCE